MIPFSHEIVANEPLEGRDFIPYGSTFFTKEAHQRGWRGCYYDPATFTYAEALKQRPDMLNDGLMTVDEAIAVLSDAKPDSRWFLRPSADLKNFCGHVCVAAEAAPWLTEALVRESDTIAKHSHADLVVLNAVKDLWCEWRYFLIDGKIVSGSVFRFQGKLHPTPVTSQKTLDEAQALADGWLPHKHCVMDLAMTTEGLKVVEFNCINASGFYGNDMEPVFRGLWETRPAGRGFCIG